MSAGRPPWRGPRAGVLAMTFGLLLLAALMWFGTGATHRTAMADPALAWWVLAPLFAVAEVVVLHVQIRREAQTISLSEIPLVLALFLATPTDLLAAAVVGSAGVYVLYRRQSLLKSLFNTTLRIFGVASALALMHLCVGQHPVLGPRAWAASIVAVAAVGAADGLLVLAAVGMHDGTVARRDIVEELYRYPAISAVVGCVGVLAVLALNADSRSAPLLGIVGLALFAGYRAHASLNDQHDSLARLYQLGRSVTGAIQHQDILLVVLTGARELLRAEAAEIVLHGAEAGEASRRWVLAPGSSTVHLELIDSQEHPALWPDGSDGGAALLLPRGAAGSTHGRQLARLGYREGIVVPLRDESGLLGSLAVADRLGEVRTFQPDDVPLLETVANQASLALANARLLERLRHEAMHDVLTGLANRAAFRDGVEEALSRLEEGVDEGFAVLLLDLDGFKEVNDSLGHHGGDALLIHVAQCLTRAAVQPATVARLGGDEFAVLLPSSSSEDNAQAMADRIHRAIAEPLQLDGGLVRVGTSIGVALAPRDARDVSGLLRAADAAMYQAKFATGAARSGRV